MQCGSAIDSINHAAWKILAGQADIIIAGGMESYSQRFAKFSMSVQPYKLIPPGNASGQNDGAAFVLMMSAEKAKELGYQPMAKWIAGADYGCDPKIMGIGSAYAVPRAIKLAGLKLSDFDHMECNEAFAVQNLAVIKELENLTGEKVDREKWNPLGGAIAYGHPNGAPGARVCMFTMRHLVRTGGRYGFFSSCRGGWLGVAAVIENLQR
jgi:acetyl-CoA acetyltransferase